MENMASPFLPPKKGWQEEGRNCVRRRCRHTNRTGRPVVAFVELTG
jgi:hypothetical protein